MCAIGTLLCVLHPRLAFLVISPCTGLWIFCVEFPKPPFNLPLFGFLDLELCFT